MTRKTMTGLLGMLAASACLALAGGCRDRRGADDATAYAAFVRGLIVPDRIARLDAPQSDLVASTDPTGGNNDFNNYVGREGTNWAVLADLTGPGWVSRFWTTGGAGADQRLQFYFDGERRPRIDATVAELRAGTPPFIPALSRYEQSCWYTFVPIPFQKRLRILAQTDNFTHTGWPRLFYQLNVQRLPADMAVPTFPTTVDADAVAALTAFGADFEAALPIPADAAHRRGESVVVAPGASAVVLALEGAGLIRELSLDVQPPEGVGPPVGVDRGGLVFQAAWDGQAVASIDAPLNAFFGKLWESPDYASAHVAASGSVVRCRLPMLYRAGAAFSVSNAGPLAVRVTAAAQVAPAPPADVPYGYLHAAWHVSGVSDRGRPHRILQARGRGKVVGCLLGVNSADPSWWVLEGDESIRSDDETRPGWLGTGLEDYFSGAWYYKNNLVRPHHGLVFKRPFMTIQYRFHLDDARRFERAAEMVFERGPDQLSPADMASVGYFYLDHPAPAGSDPVAPARGAVPTDPYVAAALMTTLCNFERLGDYQGASARIDRHLAGGDTPDAEILRLRQLAYREHLEGFAVARPLYEAFLASTTNEPAASYARLLLWVHEAPDRALLSLNCGGPTRVYLDGATVGEVGHPQAFVIVPLTLTPGRHVLCLQTYRSQPPEWAQAGLRTHAGLHGTGPDWQFAFDPRGNWRDLTFDATAWQRTGDSIQEGPPPLPYVATQPHPFVDMQSQPWGIWANAAWPPDAKTVVFRHEFEIP